MNNPVLQAIAERRSIRAYKADPLSDEQWDALIKAALEAPSARNDQPWHFTLVKNKALLKDINAEAVKEFELEPDSDIFYDAPAAIFISCDPESRWGRHDCGIAVENIALAAHSIGLGSVILGLPEGAF
jgi:nitroreductase